MSGSSVLDSNVLVLNRFYMAIRVVNVRRAMTLLYRDCAEVIVLDRDQYVSYDFDSWCELSQLTSLEKQPDEDYLQAVNFELRVPRIVRLTRFDKMPAPNGPFQSQEFVQSRRLPVPILWPNPTDEQAQPGPRHPTFTWWANDLGEHRVLLLEMQRSQRRTHATASKNEVAQSPDPTAIQSVDERIDQRPAL